MLIETGVRNLGLIFLLLLVILIIITFIIRRKKSKEEKNISDNPETLVIEKSSEELED